MRFACGGERLERALDGALTRVEGEGKCRSGPRFAVGEQGEDGCVRRINLDRMRQDDDAPRITSSQVPLINRDYVDAITPATRRCEPAPGTVDRGAAAPGDDGSSERRD